ncbi:MAG: hypothetical protein ACKOQ4_08845, partial [Mycobacterium sp.]
MSWLVAVAVPGLLMIVTVGLQRLESLLHGQAPGTAKTPLHPEPALAEPTGPAPASRFEPVLLIDEPGLPTRPDPLVQPS